ncbi:MAG: hypothetical protein QF464_06215, partial [Myxococcota bacterium]|nr:hypothetical protein [Myxococcota bacterium]
PADPPDAHPAGYDQPIDAADAEHPTPRDISEATGGQAEPSPHASPRAQGQARRATIGGRPRAGAYTPDTEPSP